MNMFKVGDVVTVTVVIDDKHKSSITTTVRATVDDRVYLDIDHIDLHTGDDYITCTRNVNYNTKIEKLCGDFVDNGDDVYSGCYPATITRVDN